jgi:hypothetical protein
VRRSAVVTISLPPCVPLAPPCRAFLPCPVAALPKGGITPDHVLIIPITHTGALATAPPSLRAEVDRFKAALGAMFASQGGRGMVLFERVLHARRGETPQHTHLQVVPLPAGAVSSAKSQLVMEAQFRYVPLSELPAAAGAAAAEPAAAEAPAADGSSADAPAPAPAAAAAAAAVDPLIAAVALQPQQQEGGDQQPLDAAAVGTVEYFYMEVSDGVAAASAVAPAPATATDGDVPAPPAAAAAAAATDAPAAPVAAPQRPPFARLLHVVPPGTKHPVQFGREMVCRLLAAPDRLSWKACAVPQEEEAAQADAFRKAFAPFDFTAEL